MKFIATEDVQDNRQRVTAQWRGMKASGDYGYFNKT